MRKPARRLAVSALLLLAAPAGAGAAVPAGFEDARVTSFDGAMSLAALPDGRLLIAGRTGGLRTWKDGVLSAPLLNLRSRLCWDAERGLVGLAVDPDFTSNRQIYLYYTFAKHEAGASDGSCPSQSPLAPVNRLSRFTLGTNNVIDEASEVVLIDNIPSYHGNHNAGDLGFGKDGYLYVSVGDGGCDYNGDSGCAGNNDASRDQHVLLGKILRITPSGGIPLDNPYRGSDSARCAATGRTDPGKRCQETFAWGLRNPFRFAFDPSASGTRFFINDTGDETWEEVNLGQKGADYGWNLREGHCVRLSTTNCGFPPAGMTDPIFDYRHAEGCAAITGGAFVPPGVWPAAYQGGYLYGDYTCGRIRMIKPSGSVYTATEFASGVGPIIDMVFAPYAGTPALYYTTWRDGVWEVRRIAATSGNRNPEARASGNPAAGTLPLDVVFDGRASVDPDGDALTYDWDFGDGSVHSSSPTPVHRYATAGTYTARLTVSDGRGGSASATVRVDAGNRPPAPAITSPTPSLRFRVGDPIALRGTAGDPEDGPLAADRLSWEVLLHHNTHLHPFVAPTAGNGITFNAPPPENLTAAPTSYLQIKLTATDSRGLSRTVSQDLRPHLVALTFSSEPSGLHFVVDGSRISTPQTFFSWEGYAFDVDPVLQRVGGQLGIGVWPSGAGRRRIVTPATHTEYQATFAKCGSGLGTALVLLGLCGVGARAASRRTR